MSAHVDDGGSRRFGGRHGYGFKPSAHASPPVGFSAHPASILSTLPSEIDHTDKCPPVLDQGQTGSCVGHSSAAAVFAAFAIAGQPLPFVPSPDDIYRGARCEDRALSHPSGELPPLTDDGTDPAMATKFLASFGCRPMRSPTKDGRYSDVEAATVNHEPVLADLEADAKKLVTAIHRIYATGKARVISMQQALVAGALRIAIDLDTAFENADGSKVLHMPDPQDDLGGHAIMICAYRTRANGAVEFKVRNSWGLGLWTPDGCVWVDESFAHALSQVDLVSVATVKS